MIGDPSVDEGNTILLVEDNPGDVRLVQEAFGECESAVRIDVVRDGEEAMDALGRREGDLDAVRPDLVLLDMSLPNTDGGEVLAEIKGDPELRRIPVLVLSSSANDADVGAAYDHHANAYLTKPVDPLAFVSLARSIEEFWFTVAELPSTD